MALVLARLEKEEQEGIKVFIAGGGDGLCAREVLKEPRVAALTLVDYDAGMIEQFAKLVDRLDPSVAT